MGKQREMHEDELQILIQGVQQGENETFRSLMEQVRPTLAAYIRRHHPQPEDQKDILQETFFNIYRAISAGHYHHINRLAFLQWIKKIAWHEIIYHRTSHWGPATLLSHRDEGSDDKCPGLQDRSPRADQQLEYLNLSQFLEQQLDEILIQREKTETKKDLGLLKKIAFLRFYVDQVSQRELAGLLSDYAANLGLEVKVSQTTINNWVSRGDILNTLVKHLVEEHRDVLEMLEWGRLCTDLNEQEKMILHQTWDGLGREGRQADDPTDPARQEVYQTARQKVAHALFLRIKEQLHLLRHPGSD